MPDVKQAVDEKLELLKRSPALVVEAVIKISEAKARRNAPAFDHAVEEFRELMSGTLQLSNLLGRRRLLLELDAKKDGGKPEQFRIGVELTKFVERTPVFPKIPFEQAIEDLVDREPRLAGSRAQIARIYEENGFAISRIVDEADLRLTKRIQEFIAKSAREGISIPKASEQIAAIGNFTESYAETVYRTNLATAFTAGRFDQVLDPDVREVAPALEYTAVMDSDTRTNHAAADGFIAASDDGLWETYRPPLGFNCRCDVRLVDRFELADRELLAGGNRIIRHFPPGFGAAGPDKGFK